MSDSSFDYNPEPKKEQSYSFMSTSTIQSFYSIDRQTDSQIFKLSSHLNNSKIYVDQLLQNKELLKTCTKFISKISKHMRNVSPFRQILDLETEKKPRLDSKTLLAETRLSSKLIRLESLVNSSVEIQNEMIHKWDLLKIKRREKTERYNILLARLCNLPAERIEDLFEKWSQYY
jgi:hypothetical protein